MKGTDILQGHRGRRIGLSLLNALLIALTVLRNVLWQGFCVPVAWMAVVLAVCSLHLLALPWLRQKSLAIVNSMLGSLTASVLVSIFPCAACSRESRLNRYFTDPLWQGKEGDPNDEDK